MWIIPKWHDHFCHTPPQHQNGLIENDRLVFISNRFVLKDFFQCLCENLFLDISSNFFHMFNRVTRFNADHTLFNDGSLVERGNHVMRCRADQFHAALISQFVRFGADEAWQERVMNVDDRAVGRRDKIGGEDFHVPSQSDHVGAVAMNDFQLSCLMLGRVFICFNKVIRNRMSGGVLFDRPRIGNQDTNFCIWVVPRFDLVESFE